MFWNLFKKPVLSDCAILEILTDYLDGRINSRDVVIALRHQDVTDELYWKALDGWLGEGSRRFAARKYENDSGDFKKLEEETIT